MLVQYRLSEPGLQPLLAYAILTLMNPPNNIYLIGPMGSGKSTVGKQLASLLNTTFIDSDDELEQRTGVSIAWIFEKEREAGFRQREEAIIAELTQKKNIVLSTGGGSIISEKNRKRLKETGFIVSLTVSIDIQLERTNRRKGARPLLKGPNAREKLSALNKARSAIYSALADLTIDTDNQSPTVVSMAILSAFKKGKK